MKRENINKLPRGYSFDTETWVVESGVPPMVCCAFWKDGAGDVLGGDRAGKLKAVDWYLKLLRGGEMLIAQNGPFDHAVMAKATKDLLGIDIIPEIFKAFAREQCYDIGLAEQEHALACGHLGQDPRTFRTTYYSLKDITSMVLGRDDAKANDAWRMRYRELDGLPISVWPQDARIYPLDDVRNTWDIAQVQLKRNKNLHDLQHQQYTDWCLALGAYFGLTVDPVEIDALWVRTEEQRAEKRGSLLQKGFLKNDKGKFKTDKAYTKRRVVQAFGAKGHCPSCTVWAGFFEDWVVGQRQREQAMVEKGRRKEVTTPLTKFKGGKLPSLQKCPDCKGAGCTLCNEGKVFKMRKCRCVGDCIHPDKREVSTWRGCPECSGTGLDLASTPFPTTETGGVSAGRDALNESGDDDLAEFAQYDETAKVLSTYIPWLREGINTETSLVQPLKLWPRVLKETGRAGYGGAIHQVPRNLGVRECVVTRPGNVLVSCDWTGAELITHAQSCLWTVDYSRMAEALLSGIKVHDQLGAKIGGVTYDYMLANKKTVPALKDFRQSAKPANFGFPGMMGAPTLAIQQRVQGPDTVSSSGKEYKGLRFCLLAGGEEVCGHTKTTEWKRRHITPTCLRCIEVANDIREVWLDTWPENHDYFEHVKGVHMSGSMTQHVTKRIRSQMSLCATANGLFQGLAGDAMKLAVQRMSHEMYVDSASILFGNAWLLLPIHDEALCEVREEYYVECSARISEIMVKALQDYCPDLAPAVEAEAAVMRRWSKYAEPVYVDGVLQIWEPS